MESALPTIALSLGLVLAAFALLAIGYLLTGKSKLRPGGCGRAAVEFDKDKKCGTEKANCPLCQGGQATEPKKEPLETEDDDELPKKPS